MEDFYIPLLHSFAMGNPFTGSKGLFRFKIEPTVVKLPNSKEVDFASSSLTAEYWHGLYCYEKSQIEDKKEFPLSVEGRSELINWLISNI